MKKTFTRRVFVPLIAALLTFAMVMPAFAVDGTALDSQGTTITITGLEDEIGVRFKEGGSELTVTYNKFLHF